MRTLLFEIKLNAFIKHSSSLSISTLIENSLLKTATEDKTKTVLRIVQNLIEINKKFEKTEEKLFDLRIINTQDKLSISYKTIIPSSEEDTFSAQFKIINETIPNSEAFKKMYKTKLRTGIIAGNNSQKYPDLNIIDLGRELKEQIAFSFDSKDELSSYFSIDINI